MSSEAGTVRARERAGTVGAVACFSTALSITSVAVPLLIVRAGYSSASVGFLVALSAVAQIAVRFRIGALMRRVPDRTLVATAAVMMSAGSALLVLSAALVVIVVSQLLQGAARGFFWTGVQTHAVRTSGVAAHGLAAVNLVSGVGLVLGPVAAGLLLEQSTGLAMGTSAAAAAVALVAVLFMARLAPFPPTSSEGRGPGHSRPAGVRLGASAAASAGAWRGLLGAYVPVVLNQASFTSSVIGVVVGAANTATVAAGWCARWVRGSRVTTWLYAGIAATGLGLALFAVLAEHLVVGAAALVVSALGMGLLQTLGPAHATDAVHADDRGDAMATVGLHRAAATFVAPFGVGALALALPVGWALAAIGVAAALPAGVAFRRRPGSSNFLGKAAQGLDR